MTQTPQKRQFVRRRPSLGTGTISLLVIFTVLCFSTLALLSLTSAVNNQRIHHRSLLMAHSLTTAEGDAARTLAQLDETLFTQQQAYAAADNNNEVLQQTALNNYYQQAFAAARELGFEVDETTLTATCRHTVDNNNELITVLTFNAPEEAQRYHITAQYSLMTGEWTPDNSGQHWPGNG